MASTDAATPNRDNPGLVSGKLVVIASIVVFVLIGVAFWAAGKWFSAHPIEADDTLDYADRAEWVVMPATTILLTEPPRYMRGPYGSKIKKELPFTLTFEEVYRLQDYSEYASTDGSLYTPLFESTEATKWYEHYVSASHYDDIDDYTQSFKTSPATMVLHFVTPDEQAFANRPIGDIELAFARKQDDVLDDSLRLLYPNTKTDELGRVYLPVFDTPLQVSIKPDPPGYKAEYPFSGWLIFPGKVGGPEPIVVRPKSE